MVVELAIRENHKNHLLSLLSIKAANEDMEVKGLQDELKRAIAPMEQEDIAWVEKLAGVKVL
jgi:hypothetical protein